MQVIIWDFDGVIVNSNHIREDGFRYILSAYPEQKVSELLEYHNKTGGVSRIEKIRYFYSNILKRQMSPEALVEYGNEFKNYMLLHMKDESIVIDETIRFIASTQHRYMHFICSGSDGSELDEICRFLGIAQYFRAIRGSPPSKAESLDKLLEDYCIDREQCIYVGDSLIDMASAAVCRVQFAGYNSPILRVESNHYLSSIVELNQLMTLINKLH